MVVRCSVPARSTVVGKSAWWGASGNPCVSRAIPARGPYAVPDVPDDRAVEVGAGVDLHARLVALDDESAARGAAQCRDVPQAGSRRRRSCGRCPLPCVSCSSGCESASPSRRGRRKSKGVPSTSRTSPVGMSSASVGVNAAGGERELVVVDRPAALTVEVEVAVVGEVDDGVTVADRGVVDAHPTGLDGIRHGDVEGAGEALVAVGAVEAEGHARRHRDRRRSTCGGRSRRPLRAASSCPRWP